MRIQLKRAHSAPSRSDGARVLVERMWPRGISKEAAKLDSWFKTLAPSVELCAWFKDRPTQWPAFRRKYLEELARDEAQPELVLLHNLAENRAALTLIFSTKDVLHNNAVILKE